MDRVADRIVVQRSDPLAGEVVVPGAKNSVLKLMVASLYATGRHELTNVPDISDVETMGALLGALGVRVNRDPDDDSILHLVNDGNVRTVAPPDLVTKIGRAHV